MIEFENLECVPDNFTGKCVTKNSGGIRYYVNGKRHRLDGPAVEYPHGTKHWWINGKIYSEENFNKLPDVIMYRAGLGIFI